MQINIKRVYDPPKVSDGYRILIDRLWPRGTKKEALKYDIWEKNIAPSPALRRWFHENPQEHWEGFVSLYSKELEKNKEPRSNNIIVCLKRCHPQSCFGTKTVSTKSSALIAA